MQKSRILAVLLLLVSFCSISVSNPSKVWAADNCYEKHGIISVQNIPSSISEGQSGTYTVTLTFPENSSLLSAGANIQDYRLVGIHQAWNDSESSRSDSPTRNGNQLTWQLNASEWSRDPDPNDDQSNIKIEFWERRSGDGLKCEFYGYEVKPFQKALECSIAFYQANAAGQASNGCFDRQSKISINIVNMVYGEQPFSGDAVISTQSNIPGDVGGGTVYVQSGNTTIIHTPGSETELTARVKVRDETICSGTISIKSGCTEEDRNDNDPNNPPASSGGQNAEAYELCKQIGGGDAGGSGGSNAFSECVSCYAGDGQGVWTAIGCINRNPTTTIQTLMKVGLSIAGGVALLMMLAAGFMFSTSQGDPKKTSEAKELITSAVVGILFVIFSVTILQFIGVSLFRIPGFGGT